jgi:type IV pilus assembly protein PilP
VERESLKKEAGTRISLALRLMVSVFAASALVFGASSCDMINSVLDSLPFIGKKAEKKRPSTRRRVKRKKKKVVKKAEDKLKEEKKELVYIYQPKGKTDPFLPFLKGFAKPKIRRKPNVPLTPLQKFDLSDFKLVAVVWGNFGRKALIEDNAKKGYIVEKGTLLGRNNGRVKKIEEDKIIVEEEREDALGNYVMVPVEIRLPKAPIDIQAAVAGAAPKLEAVEAQGEEGTPEVEIPTPEEESPKSP